MIILSLLFLFDTTSTILAQTLHRAIHNNDLARVQTLLEADSAVANELDDFGYAPLYLSIVDGHFEITRLLLEKGADAGHVDSSKRPAWYWAFAFKRREELQVIFKSSKNIDWQDDYGVTPLFWASRLGYDDIAVLLLNREADVNAQSKVRKTPLMEAAEKGHVNIARLLLERGAKVDIQTLKGWSALMWAAESGHTDVVTLLLANDAEFLLVNNQGESALDIAKKNNHKDVVEVLEKAESERRIRNLVIILIAGLASLGTVLFLMLKIRKSMKSAGP